MGNYESNCSVTEREMLKIARFVCRYSPGNILLIGGGCVLSETAGYPRLRGLSDDLDFVVNDEGLESIRKPLNLRGNYKNGQPSSAQISYVNDILTGFFHREIRGWKIPEEIFEKPRVKPTSEGVVYMIPAELNVALKIRRGASRKENPHIFGKDTLDAASIFIGTRKLGEKFDARTLVSHIREGVCGDCNLPEHRECVANLKQSGKQLVDGDRSRYLEFIDLVDSSLKEVCPKKSYSAN